MPPGTPTAPVDVDRARADTPGCELVVHLNHAGASLAPRPVLDAQLEWLQAEALTGAYELAADRDAEGIVSVAWAERGSSHRTESAGGYRSCGRLGYTAPAYGVGCGAGSGLVVGP
jgi:hypothetical protein